ncbi:MAG: ribosomal RNA small subunit methyltransferase A [Candidatus Heimdallarchaeota archaeon]|nr:ribosomal RNA small subunit methyltransferase A [Candidatus Heimdallarchaeota archaeon]MCK5048810.1 ribosomal RNA small subunit methyltransferase A [Candidatus Heimdallarchaeota archaeon]
MESTLSECWPGSSLLTYTRKCISNHSLTASKYRGQNFLISSKVIRYQIKAAQLSTSDHVYEIGPGLGALTICLSKVAKKVTAVEIDDKIVTILKENEELIDKIELIEGDALKTSIPGTVTHIVSNLPYSISSPITFHLMKYPFKRAILMYQKEVAERLIAQPNSNDYSRLSVMSQLNHNIKYLKTIPPSAFIPKPKVESAIVEITPRDEPRLKDITFFEKLVRSLFISKNKTVRRQLRIIVKHYKRKKSTTKDWKDLEMIPHLTRRIRTLNHEELLEIMYELEEEWPSLIE